MGLTDPILALGRFLLLSTSPKFQTVFGMSPFFTNVFQLATLLALLVRLNLSFLIDALACFFKITKVAPFESVEMFRKDPFLALYFSLFIHDLPACLPSSVSCFLYADDLAICSSSPSVSAAVEVTQGALI